MLGRKTSWLITSIILVMLWGCNSQEQEPFFLDWKFNLGEVPEAKENGFDDAPWQKVSIPHDWSIEQSYTTEKTAASTGFLPGGIGWYRKSFVLGKTDGKHVRIEFDGIYNNSKVWLNGVLLGERPYGYSSFSYDLTKNLLASGEENVIAVRVNRTNYADSRWYTGSGIYRDVRLVVTDEVHIPQWGVQITTPEITPTSSRVHIEAAVNPGSRTGEAVELEIKIADPNGAEIDTWSENLDLEETNLLSADLDIESPILWSLEAPNLYTATVSLKRGSIVLDQSVNRFGIRDIRFDADKGFFLNDKSVKLKGVNIHHDAGCVGAAVPRDIWVSRIKDLQSVGCNAVRLSHNPHDPALLDVCDELGMLAIAEAFDEWSRPKDKSINWLSDNAAPAEVSHSYPEHFYKWGERDIKDLVRRDFNHPSVIMWSLGNEVEWTFPYYPAASSYAIGNLDTEYFSTSPEYAGEKIRARVQELNPGTDSLALIAQVLAAWVRELDTSRYITSGCVHPSVGFATGYCTVLDAVGFNYRAAEYDGAHAMYPDAIIYGSENWVTWPEWEAVNSRDFVAGIFVWTGFAYKGEAGPWPRKGLNISLFDFSGKQTPRGHFFETLWKDDPKVHMATNPESTSEFTHSQNDAWIYTERIYEFPKMNWLRRWEWPIMATQWDYNTDERIVVFGYSNCQEAELFLNGQSQGKLLPESFDDRLMKWLVPYSDGELKIVGYNNGEEADAYVLQTAAKAHHIALTADRSSMSANHRDVVMVEAQILDEAGIPVRDQEMEIHFSLDGSAKIIGVDNGWEFNVQDAKADRVLSHQGRAQAVIQSRGDAGQLSIIARAPGLGSNEITLQLK